MRSRTALHALALGVLVAAMFAPAAFAYYRCRMMATTLSSPCCGEAERSRGDEPAQLQPESCCSKETVAIERAPSELTPKEHGPLLPPLVAVPAAVAVAAPPCSLRPPVWTRAQFDSGAPLIIRVCSLLI